jgi:hypothetical protein
MLLVSIQFVTSDINIWLTSRVIVRQINAHFQLCLKIKTANYYQQVWNAGKIKFFVFFHRKTTVRPRHLVLQLQMGILQLLLMTDKYILSVPVALWPPQILRELFQIKPRPPHEEAGNQQPALWHSLLVTHNLNPRALKIYV